jgi:hypothetical protein
MTGFQLDAATRLGMNTGRVRNPKGRRMVADARSG